MAADPPAPDPYSEVISPHRLLGRALGGLPPSRRCRRWRCAVAVLWALVALPSTMPAAAEGGRQPERLALWTGQAPAGAGASAAAITVHRPAQANGTLIVICPGGGYGCLMVEPEGHGIARWLNQHGIVGAVLEYRLPKGNPLVPLQDAQRAIRLVRSRAKDWDCDAQRIGIMGFSAGGHLAATAATHVDDGDPAAADPVARLGSRPDFAILVYPVITMGQLTHAGSRYALLGPNPQAQAVTCYSNEQQVTERTPPAFLAHAQDDTVVPPDNSRMFYEALLAHHVAAEYLRLPSGNHGLNGYRGPMWDAWQSRSLAWLAAQHLVP